MANGTRWSRKSNGDVKNGGDAGDAIETAVKEVEDFPYL